MKRNLQAILYIITKNEEKEKFSKTPSKTGIIFFLSTMFRNIHKIYILHISYYMKNNTSQKKNLKFKIQKLCASPRLNVYFKQTNKNYI